MRPASDVWSRVRSSFQFWLLGGIALGLMANILFENWTVFRRRAVQKIVRPAACDYFWLPVWGDFPAEESVFKFVSVTVVPVDLKSGAIATSGAISYGTSGSYSPDLNIFVAKTKTPFPGKNSDSTDVDWVDGLAQLRILRRTPNGPISLFREYNLPLKGTKTSESGILHCQFRFDWTFIEEPVEADLDARILSPPLSPDSGLLVILIRAADKDKGFRCELL